MQDKYCRCEHSSSVYKEYNDSGYWLYCGQCHKPVEGSFTESDFEDRYEDSYSETYGDRYDDRYEDNYDRYDDEYRELY